MKNSIPLGFIRIFILLICLTSCGSKKQQKVALPADFKGPKELARLYGVRITPDDNIFLYNERARWMGVRHKLGGSTKRGVDCSGFVSIVYREVYGKQLARSSADMLKYNCKKVSRAKLQEGDLVFFSGSRNSRQIGHVGIVTEVNHQTGSFSFIHASRTGVCVSSSTEAYYQKRYHICD